MKLRLIRHATVTVEMAGTRLLLDPQLDPAGARPAVPNTADRRRNPLRDLPEPPESIVAEIHAVLLTHLHGDHLDGTALRLLNRSTALICQPADEVALRAHGFTDVRPVPERLTFGRIDIWRTDGSHGNGALGKALAPVSGWVLAAKHEPTLYIAGDTVWCDHVRTALDRHQPDVVVLNAGAARFIVGDPVTMNWEGVVSVARHASGARVVAIHLEASNHCTETRPDLRRRLRDAELDDRVAVPEDGEILTFAGPPGARSTPGLVSRRTGPAI